MCSELHYLHVLGPVFIDCIHRHGFCLRHRLFCHLHTLEVHVYMYIPYSTLYMYCQLQLLQPKVESSSVMHMGANRRTP